MMKQQHVPKDILQTQDKSFGSRMPSTLSHKSKCSRGSSFDGWFVVVEKRRGRGYFIREYFNQYNKEYRVGDPNGIPMTDFLSAS